jgi:hypothetical protein
MKYLKKYKLFEHISIYVNYEKKDQVHDSILNDLHDICLELSEEDFFIMINKNRLRWKHMAGGEKVYSVHINNHRNKRVTDNYRDTVGRIIDYMEELGYYIKHKIDGKILNLTFSK